MEGNHERDHIITNFDRVALTENRSYALQLVEGVLRILSPEKVIQRRAREIFSEFPGRNIHIFGFGKAAGRMMTGAEAYFGNRISEAAIIVPEDDGVPSVRKDTTVLRGTHPITSETSVEASRKLISKIDTVPEGEPILFLISGGGSALFEVPEEGFTITDISKISNCLMRDGADITELNCIRNALSSVKGGKLISHVRNRDVLALYISDVPHDDLSLIASGPLVASNTECDPSQIISQFKCRELLEHRPLKIVETERSNSIRNVLLLRNYDFVRKLCSRIRSDGKHVIDLGSNLKGDVQTFADSLATIVRSIHDLTGQGFWFVGGGEPTVKVSGNGRGGRCQELALRFTRKMQEDEQFLLLTAGTDGIDGTSEAMGAIVDDRTRKTLDDQHIEQCIKDSDSFTLLDSCDSSIMSGRTGNNVSDIFLGYYCGVKER